MHVFGNVQYSSFDVGFMWGYLMHILGIVQNSSYAIVLPYTDVLSSVQQSMESQHQPSSIADTKHAVLDADD
eukprot:4324309-Alexandrium_andersonii.AAC.1